ncbi:MAG: hypothetical protein ACJAZO_002484 [Myxococcota bacterium]|jgi:hypothetical protein
MGQVFDEVRPFFDVAKRPVLEVQESVTMTANVSGSTGRGG